GCRPATTGGRTGRRAAAAAAPGPPGPRRRPAAGAPTPRRREGPTLGRRERASVRDDTLCSHVEHPTDPPAEPPSGDRRGPGRGPRRPVRGSGDPISPSPPSEAARRRPAGPRGAHLDRKSVVEGKV